MAFAKSYLSISSILNVCNVLIDISKQCWHVEDKEDQSNLLIVTNIWICVFIFSYVHCITFPKYQVDKWRRMLEGGEGS